MKQFSFILLVLILLSCGKKVTVKGRVYNPIDNEGIEGIDVQLSRSKVGFFSYDGTGSQAIENTTTNQDGNYLINYRHNNRSFRLFFSVDEELYINAEPVQYNISQQNNTIDVPLVPVSYIKYHIENINCFDENDKVEIFSCNEFLQQQCELAWGGQVGYNGCFESTTDNYAKSPSGKMYYHWIVTKNNTVTHHYDTLFLEPFQEHYFEILY